MDTQFIDTIYVSFTMDTQYWFHPGNGHESDFLYNRAKINCYKPIDTILLYFSINFLILAITNSFIRV